MSYKLVFDVQTDGLRLFWLTLLPLAELLFVFIFAGVLMFQRHTWKKLHLLKIVIPVALLKVLLTLAMAAIIWDYVHLTWLLDSGRCAVVEGTVSDFRPMPQWGHGDESFSVSGVRFAYGGDIRAGFNKTAPEGGPIRDCQVVLQRVIVAHFFTGRVRRNLSNLLIG